MTDATLHFRDLGQGRPVLLLHGLGATSHIYDALIERALSRFRLIAVDFPGTGRSGAFAPMTVGSLASSMLGLLDRLGIGGATLVGHSFGGLVALELATRAPERVEALVLASVPALRVPAPLTELAGGLLRRRVMRSLSHPLVASRALGAYLRLIRGKGEGPTPAQMNAYAQALAAEDFFEAAAEGLRAIGSCHLAAERIRTAPYSRTLLWGARDLLTPASRAQHLAQAIGASLRMLEGAGHCLPEERPEAFTEVLDGLVAQSPGFTSRSYDPKQRESR